MKLPDLDTWNRRFVFCSMLMQVVDNDDVLQLHMDDDVVLERLWDALDEQQQQGVFENFSMELFRRAYEPPSGD